MHNLFHDLNVITCVDCVVPCFGGRKISSCDVITPTHQIAGETPLRVSMACQSQIYGNP